MTSSSRVASECLRRLKRVRSMFIFNELILRSMIFIIYIFNVESLILIKYVVV